MKSMRRLGLVLAVIIMAVLFVSSSMTYQQQTSIPFLQKYLVSKPFESLINQINFHYGDLWVSVNNGGYFKVIEFFIRKFAHFSTYFLLGAGLFIGLEKKIRNKFITASIVFIFAALYAASDEFHQMLTGGRTPMIQDVILDSFGALCAIIIIIIIEKIRLILLKR